MSSLSTGTDDFGGDIMVPLYREEHTRGTHMSSLRGRGSHRDSLEGRGSCRQPGKATGEDATAEGWSEESVPRIWQTGRYTYLSKEGTYGMPHFPGLRVVREEV